MHKTQFNFIIFLIIIITPLINLHYVSSSSSSSSSSSLKTSIVFATLGRLSYNFDIYTLPIPPTQSPPFITNHHDEVKLTDGISVNFNGHFPVDSTPVISHLPETSLQVVYVTERNGTSSVYLDSVVVDSLSRPSRLGSRSALEVGNRVRVKLLEGVKGEVAMMDRPSLVGERLVYVSTREDSGVSRTSWAAVYSTHVLTGSTRRLTPKGVSDFSPAVSPSGVWTAVASYGGEGWKGEVEELETDIYVFLTRDGSNRVKLVDHGGWPTWVDDHTIYFHRRDRVDGWWSVYKASFGELERVRTESVFIERVTPPGLHAFTPAASPENHEFIALATRRPGFEFRHIELFDLVKKEFKEVTRPVSPNTHHFNPFMSSDSTRVGYHKCRGGNNGKQLLLENLDNPEDDISLFRVDGSFPSFSPTGDRIAYVDLNDGYVYVMNNDGSNRRMVFKGRVFSTAWDPIRKGVIYTSVGPTFASEKTKVNIISIHVDDDEIIYKRLTHGGENNAFPSPSPDGKWIVFRSGRSGHKNLYIMDAEDGEAGGIHRLTNGPWDDTMCNWSPNGEWIAFASDRENPNSGSFEIFMIHPNGTGLHKVIQSGSGGRANHPWFSPDGTSIVFTSDYAGISAEPVSNPHHYQPYGDIFIANVDGSNIRRMTHNSYEDGTPTWGPMYMSPKNVAKNDDDGPKCGFDDCHWLNIKPKTKHGGLKFAPNNVTLMVKC
ncbi:hypothetical protein RND81_05G133500 [Saponaria officinalis]|uniref:Uncharacterized protein n=1 Tax=Saponaria officinalis TaxID=3572 RepID=A0AAW1KWN7_SAPOF